MNGRPISSPRPRLRLLLAIALPLMLFGLPVLGFFLAGVVANWYRIPLELMSPPAGVVPLPSPAVPAALPRPTPDPRAREVNAQSYEAYLGARLMDHPRQEGARAYLALLDRLRGSDAIRQFEMVFSVPETDRGIRTHRNWEPGDPLTPAQVAWLGAHGEIVDGFLKVCESGSLPGPDRDEILGQHGFVTIPLPNIEALDWAVRILAAEAQRLAASGDTPGALRFHLAILRLPAALTHLSAWPYANTLFQRAATAADLWLARAPLDLSEAAELRTALGRLHRDLFARDALYNYMEVTYVADRRLALDQLAAPWQNYFALLPNYERFSYDLRVGPWTVTVPHYPEIARTSLRAMRLKREAPRLLQEYDGFWIALLKRFHLTYPELHAAGPLAVPRDNPLFMGRNDRRAFERLVVAEKCAETRLNLARAALERMLAPTTLLPQDNAERGRDGEDPWHDPFADAPLRLDVSTTSTLIYSLGPDLADQHGRLEYDPTNGTLGPGDMTIVRLKE